MDKPVDVIKEIIVERPVEREVFLEIEVPVIKHVYIDKEVEREVIIVREIPVIREVFVDREVIRGCLLRTFTPPEEHPARIGA